jgi:hypothetical protein
MKKVLLILVCLGTVFAYGQNNKIDDACKKEFPGLIPAGDEEGLKEMRHLKTKYGLNSMKKVRNGSVWVGITDELCLFGLTEPNSIKTTYTKNGKTEVWIYQGQANGCVGDCPDLDYVITFKNHVAIAITTGS